MVRIAGRATYDVYRDAQTALRANAMFLAFPPQGYGPARQPSRSALAAANLPAAPVDHNAWVQNQVNRGAVATALQNNTNGASTGWTQAERQAMTAFSVQQAIF